MIWLSSPYISLVFHIGVPNPVEVSCHWNPGKVAYKVSLPSAQKKAEGYLKEKKKKRNPRSKGNQA
jgi:hypothetical protein